MFFDCVTVLCFYVSLGNGLACLRLVVSNFDCVTAIGYLNLSGIWQVKIVGKDIVHTLVTLVFSVRSFTDSFMCASRATTYHTSKILQGFVTSHPWAKSICGLSQLQLANRIRVISYCMIFACVCIFPLNQTWNARQEDGDCRCMFSNFDVMGDFFSEL